ncbi:Aldehyde dehydrogenase (NAD(+)) [Thalassoporum mexicanum PCC 7367]|uniref:NADP-dependent glyceraldehyde-3-phosphate dehydrogenase n=1 Tax=Thalassoporum mexicanum TaxID=3457544 RepID=UPI00029F8715|nr:NADP-dependent glyceraldehyde-3-phosphate dehydrogenase [Pseudanabaena sp. PCC 7367]AFY70132.1 Aldehyde dehydrogenase (NAD(+)) [Pseudanabaena sp. PCC 7367]
MQLADRVKLTFPKAADIPAEFDIPKPIDQKLYLINGELRYWEGAQEEAYSPIYVGGESGSSPKLIGKFPLLTEKESLEALDAAVKAYDKGRGIWPTMSVSDRIERVQDFAYRMEERRDEIVNLLMWEIGKSYKDSAKEFDRTIQYIGDTIDALKDLDRSSSRFVIEQGIIGQIRRSSLGVALCMGPSNYPLNETFTTFIPAIIMGNTVVFKPPRPGVMLYYPMLEAFRDSFPPGVINTIYGAGREVIPPLMPTGKVDILAFIGSSKVADSLKKQHPKSHRLRCALGLDAKNPGIILPSADLDLTVQECLLGTLSYNGQRCTALKMLFVHTQILDRFLEKFTKAVDGLKCGMPWEPDVKITPVPEGRAKYFLELIADAEKHGAQVINADGAQTSNTFFSPTVVYPVNSQMRLYREEQFGPVVPIVPFNDIETPIQYIADSQYGQQVSIFGQDIDLIAKLIDPLVNQVCRVNINSQCQRGPDSFPFNGRKDSAESTLSVSDALRTFSIRTIVATKEASANKAMVTKIVREHKSNFLSTDFIL